MDKNTIIGFLLMAAVVIGFSILNKPSEAEIAQQKEQARRDSIAYALSLQESVETPQSTTLAKSIADDFFEQPKDVNSSTDSLLNVQVDTISDVAESLYTLENSKVKIQLSTKGGQVASVQLKGYKSYNLKTLEPTDSLYLFENDATMALTLTNTKGRTLSTANLHFKPIASENPRQLTMRYIYGENQYIDYVYLLDEDDYFLRYDIQMVGMQGFLKRDTEGVFQLDWTLKMRQQEKSAKNEQQYSRIKYRRSTGQVDEMSESKDEQLEVTESVHWIAFKDQFFASILIANTKIENALLDTKMLTTQPYLKAYRATTYIAADVDKTNNIMSTGLRCYFGPLGYEHLASYDEGKPDAEKLDLDELVPLGWGPLRYINKYFVIPIFSFLCSTGISIGLAILFLTLIVKIVIAPLTYKSFMSSAKMRVLKPQVDEINQKYSKPEQAAEKNQAVMSLYSRAGANPISGCIPMLLQFPILVALFRFFPDSIELRQASFLWAKDLSTYDAIVTFPFDIPLLGNHLSLFCILMTITNVIYTKFNMQMTNTGQAQMPGMKWMMYLMPVFFLFLLNDYPSGLTYYYFISLLITILLTMLFRLIVDEDKVLAKLEANKAKPKKKSGFMARLEEAQRQQQQQMKQQNRRKK